MGTRARRYVAKAVPGEGWRVWDNTLHRWWGNPYHAVPAALLQELDGMKEPERIVELSKEAIRPKSKKKR
jgi:hypothetical protein